MRTSRRILVLGAVLALAMAIAATSATAKVDCDARPNHPQCGTTTTAGPGHPNGMTCAQTEDEGGPAVADIWDGRGIKTVTLTPDAPNVCIDMSNDAPAQFEMTVADSGGRDFFVNVRDSTPGDFCAHSQRVALKNVSSATLNVPGPDDPFVEIPAATVNVCGTEYSDNDTYEATPDPHPIVYTLMGSFFGKSNPDARINVTITSSLSPLP